jgi:hypothetical protein
VIIKWSSELQLLRSAALALWLFGAELDTLLHQEAPATHWFRCLRTAALGGIRAVVWFLSLSTTCTLMGGYKFDTDVSKAVSFG